MSLHGNKYDNGFVQPSKKRRFTVSSQNYNPQKQKSDSEQKSPALPTKTLPQPTPPLKPKATQQGRFSTVKRTKKWFGSSRKFKFPQMSSFLNTVLRQAVLVFSIALLLFSVVSQTWLPLMLDRSADLTPQMKTIVGNSRDDTGQYLITKEGGDYAFAVPASEAPEEGGDSEHTGRHEDAYELYAPKDAKDGIMVTEKNSKIAVTLIPKFHTNPAEKVDGDHLVYTTGPNKLVYTLKYNGLKEDIIIPEFHSANLAYSFTLRLPAGVEAKKDSQGNIGIYSGDPSLFGDISFGSDEDSARVEKARINGSKTNLVMTIPAPLIKDANGNEYYDNISFNLSGKQETENEEVKPDLPADIPRSMVTNNDYVLTLKATNLDNQDLAYPISLDPTFQVADANDFNGVQVGDGTDIDMDESVIKRMPLTGGVLNGWTTDPDTTLPQTGPSIRMYAYNGYFYYFRSGFNIQRAPISSSGDIGAFIDTGVQTLSTRHAFYNQYIYGTWSNNWQYARINANGGISAFTATTMHAAQGGEFEVNTYANYIYLSGGGTTTGCPLTCNYTNSAAIQYAQIYADGSLSSWASAGSNFTGARRLHQMPIHNGIVYVIGGWQGETGTEQTTVNYARLQSNGTVGTWQTTTATTGIGANTGAVFIPMSGYMYKVGGYDADSAAAYAQINADGSLGTWITTSSLNTGGRGGSGWMAYNGRIYISGGSSNGGSNQYADIQYATPKATGYVSKVSSYNPPAVARQFSGRIAYNGYIYQVGGQYTSLYYNTVYYAPISETGTVGSWLSTLAFDDARSNPSLLAYNGFLYIIGGLDGTSAYNTTVEYGVINANGTIGSWAYTQSLPIEVRGENSNASNYNGRVYVQRNGFGSVYKSTINSNGTLGSWTQAGLEPGVETYRDFQVYNGFAYSFWATGGLYSNRIFYAPILSDGNLGSWTETTARPGAYSGGAIGFSNGYIYQAGGIISGLPATYEDNVYFAKINTDGSIGNWILSNSTLSVANRLYTGLIYNNFFIASYYADGEVSDVFRLHNGGTGNFSTWSSTSNTSPGSKQKHGMIAYDGYLYVVGGCNAKPCTNLAGTQSVTNASLSAPIGSDGKIGAWTTRTFMNNFRAEYALVQANGYLYAIGGCTSFSNNSDACNNVTTTVEYAKIMGNGVLSLWTLDSTNVIHSSSPGKDTDAAVHNNRIYIIPGLNIATVKFTNLNPTTGAISAWTSVTALPSARGGVGFFAVGNYLYAIGGCTNYTNCATLGNTSSQALVAQINSDGTLGLWVQKNVLPKGTIFFGDAQVVNGYVYLIGGFGNGVSGSNTVYGALTSGGVDHLDYANATFTVRSDEANAYYDGRLYTSGGASSGTIQNYMQDAPLRSIPRKGTFTRAYQFDQAVRPTTLITRGTKAGGATVKADISYNAACNNTAYTNTQNNSNIELTLAGRVGLNSGVAGDNIKCMLVRYTLDDTKSAVFPDENNETNASEILYYFRPSPQGRLRGGKTFINGENRGLDVQPD